MFKKYKQFIFGILVGALLFGGISAIADTQIQAFLSDIKVTLNGTPLQLDNPPIMYQDRTYLPVRKIAEAVGKQVDWNEASNTVVIEDKGVAVSSATPVIKDGVRIYLYKEEEQVTLMDIEQLFKKLFPNKQIHFGETPDRQLKIYIGESATDETYTGITVPFLYGSSTNLPGSTISYTDFKTIILPYLKSLE